MRVDPAQLIPPATLGFKVSFVNCSVNMCGAGSSPDADEECYEDRRVT